MDTDVTIDPTTLTTADGLSLEAEVASPASAGEPVAVAAVCHPHPLYGGSMHNNVVHRLFADLPRRAVPTLRFNFRGTGRSEGSHGGGRDETADVVAAIDALAARHPDLPLLLAGYSFGADVALSVADPRIGAWLAVSPPLSIVDPAEMAAGRDPRPKVVVAGTAADFRPAASAVAVTAGWANTRVHPVDGTDHFWMQGLDRLSTIAGDLVDELAR